MFIKVSYDEDFDELMMHLRAKYGKKLFTLDGIGKQLDMNQFSREFFTNNTTTADISTDSNSNVDSKDVIAYNFELPKPFMRYNSYYVLWKKLKQLYGHVEANKIIEMQLTGDIYINDFSDIGRPYCFNYSVYDIMLQGLPMVKKIKSIAPKHLYAFKSQLEQFVVVASNSTLGATGLADIFIVMSHYVRKILKHKADAGFEFASEKACWNYVKENIVSFIYTINQPMRGNQSPFTNVSIFDRPFLDNMCDGSYKDLDGNDVDKDIVMKIQEIFLNVMNEELNRTPITFPVTTACFCVDDENNIIDEEFTQMIAEKNKNFGFINIYCGKSSTLSSCCRLRSDQENEYFNSFGAGSSKIGSLGVVTMNLPRLAVKSIKNNKDDAVGARCEFLNELRECVEDVGRINNAKRHIITKRIGNGNLPLYELGFMNLSKQYSTAGVTGLNEICELFDVDILESEGQEFILNCLEVINTTNDKLQKQYKAPHNCEQVPAENSSIKLATKDTMLGYNDAGYRLFSNQFIPLVTKADMLDRIRLQGLFDKHFSGGAIAHINIGQRIEDTQQIVDLIKSCAKAGVVYWAINYNIQRCVNDHMSVGMNGSCVVCGAEIKDNFTRVVGFLTNTKNWHQVRREDDYPERQFYGGASNKGNAIGDSLKEKAA